MVSRGKIGPSLRPVSLTAAGPGPTGEMPPGMMPDVQYTTPVSPTLPALTDYPEHFHAVMNVEGVSTGLRTFAPGSLEFRDLPFAFRWQQMEPEMGGHALAVQVGLVTRVEHNGPAVEGYGPIDLQSPDGVEYARQLVEGFARWVSVGIDESLKEEDVEYVWPQGDGEGGDGDGLEMLFAEPEQIIFHKARVAELTAVSTPAQQEAIIEPTQPLIDALQQMGVITQPDAVAASARLGLTAAAVGSHKTSTSDGTWDAGANEKQLPSPMPVGTARKAYAWIDDGQVADGELPKTGGKFIHHEVGTDGTPGAANTTACSSAIGVLNGGRGGTTIPAADRQGVYNHLAAHLRDAGQEPPPLQTADTEPLTAAGHTITIPDLPPAAWFEEPTDAPPIGALHITDEGRVYGYLAPAGVTHRAFRGQQRVTVPRGVDYSEFLNKTVFAVDDSGHTVRVAAGNVTFGCGHANPGDPRRSDPNWALQHYDNSCSVAARIRVGENQHGTWVAGALLSDVTGPDVERMVACALSGDWQGGKLKAALLVPVEGFPTAYAGPSVRVAAGALVAASVPVRLEPTVAAAGPNLRPALERLARSIGRDGQSRLAALRVRVDKQRRPS